jgi:hypothetical protein
MATSSVDLQECGCEKRPYVCRSYSNTGIITVLKSVARIRAVKTKNVGVFMCEGEL